MFFFLILENKRWYVIAEIHLEIVNCLQCYDVWLLIATDINVAHPLHLVIIFWNNDKASNHNTDYLSFFFWFKYKLYDNIL